MRKKALAVMLTAAMVSAVLTGCGGNGGSAAGSEANSGAKVVKIGVYEPASGDNGAGGKQETLGMQYANSKIGRAHV